MADVTKYEKSDVLMVDFSLEFLMICEAKNANLEFCMLILVIPEVSSGDDENERLSTSEDKEKFFIFQKKNKK